MSRAYRITVKESETRSLRGTDEIGTRLELLDILPPEPTAELLRAELKARGFAEVEDGTLVRRDGSLTVTLDPCDGSVVVRSEVAEDVTLEAKHDATAFDDAPGERDIRARAREVARQKLDQKAEAETERLQQQATDALEKHLDELRPELGRVVNKVTREALKQKAAQLGTITELAEDAESGSLTIKVEV